MASTSRCLLLLDLQNEFLSPGGHFPIHESSRTFLDDMHKLVYAFRSAGNPIFWVRSEYKNTWTRPQGDDGDASNILSGTHTGRKPCCAKDSTGAEFPENIAALISASSPQSENVIITKTWYSAFKETTLLTDLRNRGITELYVGGLMTNVCVIATVTRAQGLAFNVKVVEDCLGWRKRESHERALQNMCSLPVQVVSSQNVIRNIQRVEAPIVESPIPRIPMLYYVNGSIPSWRVLMSLYEKGIQFEAIRLKVMSNPKETRLPAFLALNHRGKTPVFVDILPSSPVFEGDSNPVSPTTINVNESLAILQYLEDYHRPERPLLPPVSQRASRALVLSRIQETENLHHAYDALEDAHFEAANSGEMLDGRDRAQLIHVIHSELNYWEVYAGKSTFIGGDQFGLADCAFFPLLAYMVHRGFNWRRPRLNLDGDSCSGKENITDGPMDVDAWPNLKAYFHRVWNRDGENGCAQKAQPEGWRRRGKADVWNGSRGKARNVET